MPGNIYKQTVIIVIMLLSFRLSAGAQTITGVIKDATSQEPVYSSSVMILGYPHGTTSDAFGQFVLTFPASAKSIRIVVSSLGYQPDTVTITKGNNFYEILLKPTQGILNEVVITGVSKATLLRENPVAIVSVHPKAIEGTIETNIIDVLVKHVPGLNAVRTGPNISKPFIRGLGYNRVLTLYDGIRQEGQQWGDEHGIEVDAYAIRKAEVVKGPASIMYGSDAVAGVVSLLPEKLANKDENINGKFISEYQSNNGLIGNAISITHSKNHWAFAWKGSYRIAKNYTNKIESRVYNTGFREMNASATIQHFTKNGFSNLNLTLYDNLQGIPDGSRDSLSRKFTRQIEEGKNDDVKDRPIVPSAILNSYRPGPLHQHIQHYRIYSNNNYKIGNGGVDISLAFQQNIRREFTHPTAPQQAGLFVRLNTLNYGIRYNAPTVLNTEVSIGINGMYQNNKSKSATDFPIPDHDLLDVGGYVFAKWKQKRFTISAGLRYDIRRLNGKNFYTRTNPISGFDTHAMQPDTAGAYLRFPSFNKRFTGNSMSLGATYELNDHIHLKLNVAKGYRAPTITEFASNGLDPGAHIIYLGNRNFSPEFSLQEDVGLDFRLKSLDASVSAFNNHIRNYIYLSQLTDADGNAVVDAQGNKTFQYQQAKAQLYGLEANLNFHPSFLKGFSFHNAFSIIYAYNRKPALKGRGVDGEYLPLIPPAKLISSIDKEIKPNSKVISSIKLKTSVEHNAAQNRFMALSNTETATPGYTLFNFSVNTQIKYSKTNTLLFLIQVNNAFDKTYQSHISRLKYFEYYEHSPTGHFGMYDMGRNICIKGIMMF